MTPRSSGIVLASHLSDVFTALGYVTTIDERRLTVEDEALLSTNKQVIVAGNAQFIPDDEVTRDPPRFVVVEDDAPRQHVERLELACRVAKSPPTLMTFSRFLDPLWQADRAARAAQADAASAPDLDIATGLTTGDRSNPQALYADQAVASEPGSGPVSALVHCETWLEGGEGTLVVLAPAGLGKSELTAVLEWRAALKYFNATVKRSLGVLPPVALRVPLRDLPATGFSLDSIAEYLRSTRGLERVRNGEVLVQLLVHGRLVLLLDGLDELRVPRSRMGEGLADIAFYAEKGARVLLTSRLGYYGSEGIIRDKLSGQSIVTLQPLAEQSGLDLLARRGASVEDARVAFASLTEELRGVPLFLIWAWRSGYARSSGEGLGPGRARALIEFVRLFCVRDEPRVGLDPETQIEALTDLAYQSAFVGPVTRTDFVYLVGEEDSPMVEGPHALLRLGEGGVMEFREATFENLFLAYGIIRGWSTRRQGGSDDLKLWLGDRFGSVKLEALCLDFLSELLSDQDLREGWLLASQAPARFQPFARRNLLGVALSKLRDAGDDQLPPRRSEMLADLIGGKDLSDTVLIDLVIERLIFDGWDLSGCVGRGAYVAFCDFEGATFEEGLTEADVLECNGLSAQVTQDEIARRGMKRLTRALGPWRNHAVSDVALKPELSEETRGIDTETMRVMRAEGLATLDSGRRGNKYWKLSDQARRMFRETIENPSVTSPELQPLLIRLGS